MHKLIIPFLLLSIVFSGCTRLEIEKDTPSCVKDKIVDFGKNQSCDDIQVDEYEFQNTEVYVLAIGNTCGADMYSDVIDSECNVLGSLGGITGNWEINGESFENAVFINTVWKK